MRRLADEGRRTAVQHPLAARGAVEDGAAGAATRRVEVRGVADPVVDRAVGRRAEVGAVIHRDSPFSVGSVAVGRTRFDSAYMLAYSGQIVNTLG